MSYDSFREFGLTELERSAGVGALMNSKCGRGCWCRCCESRDWDQEEENQLRNSERFKQGAKIVAGLNDNKKIKLALIKKIHQEGLNRAILRYARKESLPTHYISIASNSDCIPTLIDGVFYKVCKIKYDKKLSDTARALSRSLQTNLEQRIVYDRVADIQHFIHDTIDRNFGIGAARSLPVAPMKNALSASRLHLHIFDTKQHSTEYNLHINKLSTIAAELEYKSPRPPAVPWGKHAVSKWRVRHLQPLTHFATIENRKALKELIALDTGMSREKFCFEAIRIYVTS